MKNEYQIVEAGTEITLLNEFDQEHTIVVDQKTVIIYANGHYKNNWKILIDYDDLTKVDEAVTGRWYVKVSKGTIYALHCKQINNLRVYTSMHRLITDCEEGYVPDHDPHHYGLDNRKCNLKTVTISENNKNQMLKLTRYTYYKF